jgi:hypothetical protein
MASGGPGSGSGGGSGGAAVGGASGRQPTLRRLFVFNTELGPKEGQEAEKILYFWPPDVSLDAQIRDIGLAEAVARFAECVLWDALMRQRRRRRPR